jgi:hypothetical protein
MGLSVCPTCGAALSAKIMVYEKKLKEGCLKHNLDYDMLSLGYLDKDEQYCKMQSKIVLELCDCYACRVALMCYVNIEKLVL